MINLLPLQQKQILLKEKEFREILILGIFLFTFLLLLGLALFVIRIDIQAGLLLEQTLLESKKHESGFSQIKKSEEEIRSLNEIGSKLDSFYENKYYLISIFETLNQVMPENMYLTNFSYDAQKAKISLSCFAPSREVLSQFKANLEQEQNFKELYFPASNWLKPNDIDFFVSFQYVR